MIEKPRSGRSRQPRFRTAMAFRALVYRCGSRSKAGMPRCVRRPLGNRLTKKKGLQLSLEPLNGRGIAGYVPKPKLWARPLKAAPREESHVVGALAVIADVETLAFLFDGGTQANDQIDDLVEDRRADAGPDQRRQHRLALRNHLGDQIVGAGVVASDVGVVGDADATERGIDQDAGAERTDDAADAMHAEHVERVVIAER